jgi:hypothetical protein
VKTKNHKAAVEMKAFDCSISNFLKPKSEREKEISLAAQEATFT